MKIISAKKIKTWAKKAMKILQMNKQINVNCYLVRKLYGNICSYCSIENINPIIKCSNVVQYKSNQI